MEYKRIIQVNGPVIIAKGVTNFAMHDMVMVGNKKLMGEVIDLQESLATIQVYEETSGLQIGERVVGTNEPLSLVLGPGLMGNVLDGIERPLYAIQKQEGDFIPSGVQVPALDLKKEWDFTPQIQVGETIEQGMVMGEVPETQSVMHRVLYPLTNRGTVSFVAKKGSYTVSDVIARVTHEDGTESEVMMQQKWPVRKQRPYRNRLLSDTPLLTGQRVIDTIFPIAKGGTATIPGGFGTGKTMLQHQLAKWCDADIIVYIGCGERGNEMTQVLEDFPTLIDPRTNRPLMERTILIANTSNMPVAARETSIYTGITIAEYYRDMGYDVALMADSTSRWAEALREISGRLEEMPAEEGFPSYLPSRLSAFYGRAGKVETLNGTLGSVTLIGAVSPQGSDFSEPVTQNTKRFVHVFWGLDRDLAYARHYPAINWNISYSEYVSRLDSWYHTHVDPNFLADRARIMALLEEETSLLEIAKVVGKDVLQENKKLIIETCQAIRQGFLQQNSLSSIDTAVPMLKQYYMMEHILLVYDISLRLIEKGIPLSKIKELGVWDQFVKIKMTIANDQLDQFFHLRQKVKASLKELETTYAAHNGLKEGTFEN